MDHFAQSWKHGAAVSPRIWCPHTFLYPSGNIDTPPTAHRHHNDDFFALLGADWVGAHHQILIVFVAEHHHR
jgi:hypothetical protein